MSYCSQQYTLWTKYSTIYPIAELYFDVVDSWENKQGTLATFLLMEDFNSMNQKKIN